MLPDGRIAQQNKSDGGKNDHGTQGGYNLSSIIFIGRKVQLYFFVSDLFFEQHIPTYKCHTCDNKIPGGDNGDGIF